MKIDPLAYSREFADASKWILAGLVAAGIAFVGQSQRGPWDFILVSLFGLALLHAYFWFVERHAPNREVDLSAESLDKISDNLRAREDDDA